MIKLNFICTFKSKIVLHASSNTEGKIEKLNYIPGSNFLGMVARYYKDFGDDAFDMFHSGKVRFSDGHIINNKKETFQIPFSFYTYKDTSFEEAIKKGCLFVHHYLTQKDYDDVINKEKQLKQIRNGFITKDGELKEIKHTYNQKSAFDNTKRRSKDGSMFGYYALPSNTQWAFSVTLDKDMEHLKDKIIKYLISSTKLGKSKSAEYGLVKIEYCKEETVTIPKIELPDNEEYLYLYAKSRLALTDANGINSYNPSIESLGFGKNDEVTIDWTKSQIRTNRYTPYVNARQNFDPERLVIEKGSVFVVNISKGFNKNEFEKNIQKSIGLYISEGLGEIIINPKWLLKKNVLFNPNEQDNKNDKQKDIETNETNKVNKWLSLQREKQDKENELLKEVKEFINYKDNNVKYKKSQWGQIRALCRQAKNSTKLYKLLFDMTQHNGHPKGYLMHGKAKDKWDSSLIKNLQDRAHFSDNKACDDYKDFVKLLSIYAPKEDDKGGDHEQ